MTDDADQKAATPPSLEARRQARQRHPHPPVLQTPPIAESLPDTLRYPELPSERQWGSGALVTAPGNKLFQTMKDRRNSAARPARPLAASQQRPTLSLPTWPAPPVDVRALIARCVAPGRVRAAPALGVLVVIVLGAGLIAKQQLEQPTPDAASIDSPHVLATATGPPITTTLARDTSTTITSIAADGAKAAKARAAAQAKARARVAARKARARRAARARAARTRRRRQAAARAHQATQSLSTPASTRSPYTTPAPSPSAPAQSSSPSSHATSSSPIPARHPYGVGGLLSIGSSPSG